MDEFPMTWAAPGAASRFDSAPLYPAPAGPAARDNGGRFL
jgi:hypothetical protein